MSKENATQEMTAVEYLKAKARMTDDCYCECGSECLLTRAGLKYDDNCYEFECKHPEEAVAIVQKWAEEHPVKTRQSEFLKMFPNVGMCDGVIVFDPCDLDTDYEPPKGCRPECSDCRQDYWLAELPEE